MSDPTEIGTLECSIDGSEFTLIVASLPRDGEVKPVHVGTCRLWSKGEFAEVASLFVREGFRGLGIGRHLVIEACEIARARGCRFMSLTLAYVPKDASRRQFYEKLGFDAVAELSDQSLLFSKPL